MLIVGCFDILENALQHEEPRHWNHLINKKLDALTFLGIVYFADIVKLVDNQLFDECAVDFWAALETQDSVCNGPDFIVRSLRYTT